MKAGRSDGVRKAVDRKDHMMERLFQTHKIRWQQELNGIWDFQTIQDRKLPEHYTDTMSVPSCWEMTMPYCRYRGLAAYRRTLFLDKSGNLRLLFKGVSHTGLIYLDGKKVGEHYNAYTPFSVVVSHVEAGEHVLELIVDNRFTEESALHIPNDYFTYGGITRNAFWELVPDCYIERMEFEPEYRNQKWCADVRVFIRNLSEDAADIDAEISCAGKTKKLRVTAEAGQISKAACRMEFEQVEAWSMENPRLYLLKTVLCLNGEKVDDLTDRVGFRTVSGANRKILINEKPIFIKGVNRHEDHGNCGCAIPLALMDADIKLIKNMGANAVRTCHYPNDELFLDLCDENGILVWEESHDRGGDAERITAPLFRKQSMAVMHEMLEYHYNHPSIIIWGCLNEAASDCKEGAAVYQEHLDYLASDQSRLTTFASNKSIRDLCLGMESVCSFNTYPYWYKDEEVSEVLSAMKMRMEETGNGNKPMIISEYGGGGVYNFHDVMHVKWSEEYQAELITKVTEELFASQMLAGVFVWQFCDARICQEGERNWPMRRPLSRNNKGMVDEYRRPKMAYYALKEMFETM